MENPLAPVDPLDAVEDSVMRPPGPPSPFPIPEASLVDPIGWMLDELEAKIEGAIVPPSWPADSMPFTECPEPPAAAWPSAGMIPAPPAAQTAPSGFESKAPLFDQPRPWPSPRPFSRQQMQTSGGRGAGIRRHSVQVFKRLCPQSNEYIDEETCECCDEYKDWAQDGGGLRECRYDYKGRQVSEPGGDDVEE